MGVDLALESDFMRWADDLAAFIGAVRPTTEQARIAQKSLLEMAAYFEQDLLPRRRRNPEDDLVTELVQARDDGRITSDTELLAQCAMLLFAGYETTRNLLGNGMLSLLKHRDQWQRLCEQPDLAAPAVRELLRFDSPVQWTGRRAATDVELAGQPVRATGRLAAARPGCAQPRLAGRGRGFGATALIRSGTRAGRRQAQDLHQHVVVLRQHACRLGSGIPGKPGIALGLDENVFLLHGAAPLFSYSAEIMLPANAWVGAMAPAPCCSLRKLSANWALSRSQLA